MDASFYWVLAGALVLAYLMCLLVKNGNGVDSNDGEGND